MLRRPIVQVIKTMSFLQSTTTKSKKYNTWKPFNVVDELTTPQFIVTSKNGFLPRQMPLEILPKEFAKLESILQRMPKQLDDGVTLGLLGEGVLAKTVVDELPQYDVSSIEDSRLLMALFRDYTFLASAYLLEPCDIVLRDTGKFGKGNEKLPANIAVPLDKISKKIQAKPYMEYAQSYALYNFKLLNASKAINYDNLDLIRKFSGLSSEKGFILVHVDMVAKSGILVQNTIDALNSISSNDRFVFDRSLAGLVECMREINKRMEKMWKKSLPKDYLKFRTFIMGTKNQKEIFPRGVVYEGVSDDPCYYRGESGANDSIIPTMDNLLQLTEKMPENAMTEILRDFRTYRPDDHIRWLKWVEESAKELQLINYVMQNERSLLMYILLLDEIRDFRTRHWNFAKEYIIKRTSYPNATGGSPMTNWLPNQLDVVLQVIIESCEKCFDHCSEMRMTIKTVYNRALKQKEELQKK